eukprot:gene8152-1405_t
MGLASSGDEAIAEVRRCRCKAAVETRKQEDFVRSYGLRVQARALQLLEAAAELEGGVHLEMVAELERGAELEGCTELEGGTELEGVCSLRDGC